MPTRLPSPWIRGKKTGDSRANQPSALARGTDSESSLTPYRAFTSPRAMRGREGPSSLAQAGPIANRQPFESLPAMIPDSARTANAVEVRERKHTDQTKCCQMRATRRSREPAATDISPRGMSDQRSEVIEYRLRARCQQKNFKNSSHEFHVVKVPFDDGTPLCRGSMLTASRSARAVALN